MCSPKQKTILLVEDEALIAVMGKQTLTKHGFNVILASNGEKAIEIVQTTPDINLILMDINLGKGMDGTEAAEAILKEKDIPILFLSSYTQPEVVEKTEKITSYGYVVKDSGETVLLASIKMAFKLYESHQKLRESKDALYESETLQRALLANLPAGVIIIDPVTRIIENVNNTAAAMFGIQAEQIVGHRCHAFLCPAEEGACPVCDLGNVVDNSEREMICADGSRRPVLKSVKRIQIGGQDKLLECFADITERKRIEEDLRIHQIELTMQNEELRQAQREIEASRARYFDLYDLAPVGYFTVSEKGLILEANLTAASLLGGGEVP